METLSKCDGNKKTAALAAEVWNNDPELGGWMLNNFFSAAVKRDEDLDDVESCLIHRLSVGSAYLWKEMTGEELPPVRAHFMGLNIYAGAFESCLTADGEPFDKEEWLRNAWEEMRDQMDRELDDDLAEAYFRYETEEARKRLAAIKGGCDE